MDIFGFVLEQKFASLEQIYFRFFDVREKVSDPMPKGLFVTRQRLQILKRHGSLKSEKVYSESKESILKSKINTNGLDPTYLEIAQKACFYNPNKASRRLSELVRLNKITVTGTKICPIGKHRCQTYDLVNA